MNGIHDMGGMDGFGPVEVEADEPVFHERWEARIFGLTLLVPLGNIDAGRHAIERIFPAEYLSLSYYGRWLRRLETTLREQGLLAEGELEARVAGRPFAAVPGGAPQGSGRGPSRRDVDRASSSPSARMPCSRSVVSSLRSHRP